MANTAILAAFERMWQHVVAALGNKADLDHDHDRLMNCTEIYTNILTANKIDATDIEVSGLDVKDKLSEFEALTHAHVTSGTGSAYTVTSSSLFADGLNVGDSFIMVPHTVSTSTAPTLNVNGLGAKAIRRMVSNSSTSTAAGYNSGWLAANKPVRVIYNGTYWIATDLTKPSAADMSGTLAIGNGGTGATTADAARTNLGAAAKWDLLWENASPDSSFAAQTITIEGLSNYNLFIINARVSSSNAMRFNVVCYRPELDARKVDLTRFDGSNGAWGAWERDATIDRTNETVAFSTGLYSYSGSSTNSTSVAVPIFILGTTI